MSHETEYETFAYDEVIRDEDRSWLLNFPDFGKVWLPKSECEIDRAMMKINVPEWLIAEMVEKPKGLGRRRRAGEEPQPVTLLELLDFLVNIDPFKVGCKVCRALEEHAPGCQLVGWRNALAAG